MLRTVAVRTDCPVQSACVIEEGTTELSPTAAATPPIQRQAPQCAAHAALYGAARLRRFAPYLAHRAAVAHHRHYAGHRDSLRPIDDAHAAPGVGRYPDDAADHGAGAALGPAIDQLIARYRLQGIDRIGLMIEDGRETDTIERYADDRFMAASLYKLFVLWRTQVEIRQGKLLDTTELTLTAQNDDSDEDGYSLGAYGDTVSVADLRRLMIVASNNTAAQVLGQYFGWGTIDQLVRVARLPRDDCLRSGEHDRARRDPLLRWRHHPDARPAPHGGRLRADARAAERPGSQYETLHRLPGWHDLRP